MTEKNKEKNLFPGLLQGKSSWLQGLMDLAQYQVDFAQRSVLFTNALRKRANNMLEHHEKGMPPLLAFDHEMIKDGRKLVRPANYALLRIIPPDGVEIDGNKTPVVIFDPRAGHGPGIGGFKRDSEVGMALLEGHPTYFVIFFPEPCPGQTLEDVEQAQVLFLEEVANRHRDVGRPIVYGNCQAGWAVAMLGADRPDVTGPIIINGAPMSYWAGEPTENPMRVAGALVGGDWAARLGADLGGGLFDGAWLVLNFEKLNPANTLWDKKYGLFRKIDTDEDKFLEFEQWWTGFYQLNKDEIIWIVQNLFIGDRLEQGILELSPTRKIDMKNLRNPLVIFASSGDNITPPKQALDWISEIYPTTEDLKNNGQRIVYMINPHVGHLGIFVSAAVARREHRAMIEHIGRIEKLEPGLYEMIIDGETGETDPRKTQFNVRFEERDILDVTFETNTQVFDRVATVSKMSGDLYERFVGPSVRAMITPQAAELLKWMHPGRTSRTVFSDRLFPAMKILEPLAKIAKSNRVRAGDENPYVQMEKLVAGGVANWLNLWRDARDSWYRIVFQNLYGSK
ncbi:MAG: DUF3141 domain-containing protein [Pseudomonadota bacterium]